MLQQVESVAVVGSREVTPMPGEIKDELEQLSEASQKFLRETGEPDESHTQDPTEVEQRFVVDTDMQSASSKGLSGIIIRDISPVPDHPQNGNENTNASQNENKSTATTEQAGNKATAVTHPEIEALGNRNQSTADNILAQLADLEAEVMDMLDDPTHMNRPQPRPHQHLSHQHHNQHHHNHRRRKKKGKNQLLWMNQILGRAYPRHHLQKPLLLFLHPPHRAYQEDLCLLRTPLR